MNLRSQLQEIRMWIGGFKLKRSTTIRGLKYFVDCISSFILQRGLYLDKITIISVKHFHQHDTDSIICCQPSLLPLLSSLCNNWTKWREVQQICSTEELNIIIVKSKKNNDYKTTRVPFKKRFYDICFF